MIANPIILAPGVFGSVSTCTPNHPCDAIPVAMSSPAMRLAASAGMAETKSTRAELALARSINAARRRYRRVHANKLTIHVHKCPNPNCLG